MVGAGDRVLIRDAGSFPTRLLLPTVDLRPVVVMRLQNVRQVLDAPTAILEYRMA